jgi:pimeloyl-ACP methyl ester carboxylesterase
MKPLLAIVLLCLLSSCERAPTAAAPIAVTDFGSFHIGGRDVVVKDKPIPNITITPGVPAAFDPNGTYVAEQMYVQYFTPSQVKGRYPLLLWHGAWLTGATYETKPDGMPGWLNYFVKQGWKTYVSDAVERGRAGYALDVFQGAPLPLPKENAFVRFRFGAVYDADPAKRVFFPGSQYPADSYDQFLKQGVPRWTTNNEATIKAYIELVDKVCPCVVLVHSQAGLFGARVAEARPDKVKALIMVEPSNGGVVAEAAKLKNTPVLEVWGDHVETDARWSQIRKVVRQYYDAVRAAGGTVDTIDLPQAGVKGNTHMMMMDRNSDDIAAMIQKWLTGKHMLQ